MKEVCSKCKSDCEDPGSWRTEGETYYFCEFCSSLLDALPTGNTIHYFLSDKGHEMISNDISRNMLLARLRRAKGKKMWSKV